MLNTFDKDSKIDTQNGLLVPAVSVKQSTVKRKRATTSVRQRFDIAKEDNHFAASNYLNFSKVNITNLRWLSGNITFKDLTFISLRIKKGLIGAPSTIYVGEQPLSKLAADPI